MSAENYSHKSKLIFCLQVFYFLYLQHVLPVYGHNIVIRKIPIVTNES